MSAIQYGIPTPIQFDRLYAGPLDKHEVFDSYSDALTYAQGPISYPGQVLGVKKSGLKEDVYVINQDKSLSRLMIQREDLHLVLKASDWTGGNPFEQKLEIAELESTDNCIISLGDSVNNADVVKEIVNAKIADTIQEDGGIRFIARGDKPTIDIPILVTIGSIVSAVEIPNNVNDNTNHTVVIASKDGWNGSKPPYTQDLYIFGIRPDSNGTIGINPDSSYYNINRAAAATAGVVRYEQRNNYITIAAMNSKPTRDLEVLVVWGDEIVVFENSDVLEDFNTTLDLTLKANGWTENRPYTQTLRVEGLSEYHTGAIGLSDNCTVEQAEMGLNAGLELTEQGNGYITIRANDIKPTSDIPIYLIYGSNITIVPSPQYVGEANQHVDSIAYASRWVETVNGWEQEVEVEGITSNSIGSMSLRNGATENQQHDAALARIKITKIYDNKVLLTATRKRPLINIPLSFVFGRNINIIKVPSISGKVSLDTSYIIFSDTLIQSGVSSLQELLEYLQENKIRYSDIVNDKDTNNPYKPLSSAMGKEINDDLQTHKNTSTIHVPTNGTNGQYLMYDTSVDGNKKWHTLNVDGADVDASGNITHYVELIDDNIEISTVRYPNGQSKKSIRINIEEYSEFKLHEGSIAYLKFNDNIVELLSNSTSITLNINNTGAIPIYYRNEPIVQNIIKSGEIYTFVYDGTNYILLNGGSTITKDTGTKAYITGTTSDDTTVNSDQIFDTDIYIDSTAGKLHAKSLDVGEDGIVSNGNVDIGSSSNKKNLTVTGNTALNGELKVIGNNKIFGNVDVHGTISAEGEMLIDNKATFNGYVDTPNLSEDIIIKVQSDQPDSVSGKNVVWIKI